MPPSCFLYFKRCQSLLAGKETSTMAFQADLTITHVKKYILGAPGWLSLLSIQLLISAQAMISRFTGSKPVLGSVLPAQSWDLGFSLSLSLRPYPACALSLSKINKLKKKKIRFILQSCTHTKSISYNLLIDFITGHNLRFENHHLKRQGLWKISKVWFTIPSDFFPFYFLRLCKIEENPAHFPGNITSLYSQFTWCIV